MSASAQTAVTATTAAPSAVPVAVPGATSDPRSGGSGGRPAADGPSAPGALVSGPTERRPDDRPRLALLDVTRLAAALSVVLYHWTAWHHTRFSTDGRLALEVWPVLGRLTALGALGVQLFFLVSGFVIVLSVAGRSPAQYLGSRIGRLYPAYWVAVPAAALMLFVLWPELGARRSPAEILPNLTMLQGGMDGAGHLDGVYWTLWVELKFYATVLLLVLLRWTSPRSLLVFAVAWPVGGTLLAWATAALGVGGAAVSHVLFPEYSALFASGIALYLLHRHGHTPGRWAALLLCAGLSADWSAPIQARETLETTGLAVPVGVVAAVVLGMLAWVAAIVLTPAARWRVPGAKTAGALTYPLYLFHQLWGWWLIGLLVPLIGPRWTLPLVLAVLLTWSWAVHRGIERPLGPRLRRGVTRALERVPLLRG